MASILIGSTPTTRAQVFSDATPIAGFRPAPLILFLFSDWILYRRADSRIVFIGRNTERHGHHHSISRNTIFVAEYGDLAASA
jgi:hypothetical protein